MLTENTQAVLLLTCHFSKPRKGDAKPLTVSEYARFAEWLWANKYQPTVLFEQFDDVFSKWTDPKKTITADRVKALLGRGMAMSLAMEKWQQVGIWFVTRGDSSCYPGRLKQKLGIMSPPVIFGLGNKQLLQNGGLAVVGSRSIDDEDVLFTQNVGNQAANEGISIVSGGARGVDETAMLSALQSDGTALGVLADSLYKAAVSPKWRKYLESEGLCLVSPYYPEAGFSSGNAMGRNKYIYCLADHALVVRSDKDKGGTWSGATENLKKNWVPLLVKPSDVDGNQALLQSGGRAFNHLAATDEKAKHWLMRALSAVGEMDTSSNNEPAPNIGDMFSDFSGKQEEVSGSEVADQSQSAAQERAVETDLFFELFISQLKKILNLQADISQSDLEEIMSDLQPDQITAWLNRAENTKLVERVKPHGSYQLVSP